MRFACITALEPARLVREEVASSFSAVGVDQLNSTSRHGRLFLFSTDASKERVRKGAERSAFVKDLFEVFRRTRSEGGMVSPNADAFEMPLDGAGSFGVRAIRVGKESEAFSGRDLECRYGSAIKDRFGLEVDLGHPDVWVVLLLLPDAVLEAVRYNLKPKEFESRAPKRRPFVHPATLQPRTARIVFNLARASSEELLLDPFCGSGSILLEAEVSGIRTVGLEVDEEIARGAKANLRALGVSNSQVVIADSLTNPIRSFDAVATDPPYGRRTKPDPSEASRKLNSFLDLAADAVKTGSRIAFMFPKKYSGEVEFPSALTRAFSHDLRVHASLTRRIQVAVRR